MRIQQAAAQLCTTVRQSLSTALQPFLATVVISCLTLPHSALADVSSASHAADRQLASLPAIPAWAHDFFDKSATSGNPHEGFAPFSHALALNHIKRILLKFTLESYGRSDAERLLAFKAAEAHIVKFITQPRLFIQLESMSEFEAQKANEIPAFWNLKDEVSYWRTNVPPYLILTSQNPDVQDALERESAKDLITGATDAQFLAYSKLESLYLRAVLHADQLGPLLALVPDVARLATLHLSDKAIAQGLHKVDTVAEQITGNNNIKLPSAAWQRFFELILNQYFSLLDPQVKLNMLSQAIDLGVDASPLDAFQVMVLNAGPQFQKLFQIYARQKGFSPKLVEVFKKLEQASKAIPFRLVKPVIDSTRVPFKWISVSPKPIGVGTMAQVHKAVIEITDSNHHVQQRKVVVRLLKPEVQMRVAQDNKALANLARVIDGDPILRAANFPLISPFVTQIQEMTTRESKMEITIANQNLGAKLYNSSAPLSTSNFKGTIEFHVPEIIALPKDSPIMIQEFIEGTSFDDFAVKSPELVTVAVEELAKKWLTETFIGSGFFHADLHQGNLRVNQVGNKLTVTLLDFGMTGQVNEETQNKFVLYALAAAAQEPELMARLLWELSMKSENQTTQAELQRLFEVEIARQKSLGLGVWPSYEWLALAVNAGMRFPIDFATLNRGAVLVRQMLKESNSKLEFGTVLRSIYLKNPARVARLLKTQNFLSNKDWVKLGLLGYERTRMEKPVTEAPTVTGVTNPASLRCEDVLSIR